MSAVKVNAYKEPNNMDAVIFDVISMWIYVKCNVNYCCQYMYVNSTFYVHATALRIEIRSVPFFHNYMYLHINLMLWFRKC